jgi:hypothetical protein
MSVHWPTSTAAVCVQVLKGLEPDEPLDVNMSVSPTNGSAGTVFVFSIQLFSALSPFTSVVLTDVIPPQLTNAQLLTPFDGEWQSPSPSSDVAMHAHSGARGHHH